MSGAARCGKPIQPPDICLIKRSAVCCDLVIADRCLKMDASDTDHLIALVHARGLQAGTDPTKSGLDCPFCGDRVDLCRAWLAGFSIGRVTLLRMSN